MLSTRSRRSEISRLCDYKKSENWNCNLMYVLWNEKDAGNGNPLIFMRKSLLQSFLLYAELKGSAERKEIKSLYSFFNNIRKHQQC